MRFNILKSLNMKKLNLISGFVWFHHYYIKFKFNKTYTIKWKLFQSKFLVVAKKFLKFTYFDFSVSSIIYQITLGDYRGN